MTIPFSNYPHEMCTGAESVATNSNGVNSNSQILNSLSLDFFFSERKNRNSEISQKNTSEFSIIQSDRPLNKHHNSGKNEKLCQSFAPFGVTWDYSEVD